MEALIKVLLAAGIISATSWLSGKKPELAGFIIALPMVSILALLFSYVEHRDAEISITLAKSVMVGVPISYLFFLPFFLTEKFGWGFWQPYICGLVLVVLGYFLHGAIMKFLG